MSVGVPKLDLTGVTVGSPEKKKRDFGELSDLGDGDGDDEENESLIDEEEKEEKETPSKVEEEDWTRDPIARLLERHKEEPEMLPTISSLDLSRRGIDSLPDKIWVFTGLRSLNLSNNNLVQVESERMSDILVNLKSLDLSYNLIHDLRTLLPLGKLEHLQSISLEGNPLPLVKNRIGMLQFMLFSYDQDGKEKETCVPVKIKFSSQYSRDRFSVNSPTKKFDKKPGTYLRPASRKENVRQEQPQEEADVHFPEARKSSVVVDRVLNTARKTSYAETFFKSGSGAQSQRGRTASFEEERSDSRTKKRSKSLTARPRASSVHSKKQKDALKEKIPKAFAKDEAEVGDSDLIVNLDVKAITSRPVTRREMEHPKPLDIGQILAPGSKDEEKSVLDVILGQQKCPTPHQSSLFRMLGFLNGEVITISEVEAAMEEKRIQDLVGACHAPVNDRVVFEEMSGIDEEDAKTEEIQADPFFDDEKDASERHGLVFDEEETRLLSTLVTQLPSLPPSGSVSARWRTSRDLETGRMSDMGDVSLTDMTYSEFRELHLEKGSKTSRASGPLSFHTLIKKEHERNRSEMDALLTSRKVSYRPLQRVGKDDVVNLPLDDVTTMLEYWELDERVKGQMKMDRSSDIMLRKMMAAREDQKKREDAMKRVKCHRKRLHLIRQGRLLAARELREGEEKEMSERKKREAEISTGSSRSSSMRTNRLHRPKQGEKVKLGEHTFLYSIDEM
eukprot:TRINITY_DN1412_c2_g1_i1.p1 TRINITY_DN1412_c2_g1~~TRINITY_DN1412_c2_g1_i1.p1  ORF type:complete len:732 (-),score=245.78 TRINITY_DN1412_c2_g1_i1:2237-4432(-)